jgi:hypothetical protein
MPTRTYTSTATGPLTLDLRQNSGEIAITVDPVAKHAHVTVSTEATDGEVAKAVQQATFTESGSRLKVNVPITGGGGGNSVVITGNNFSSISTGGGRVIINGVDVTAEATINGTLKSLDYTGSSGNLTAQSVGDLDLGLSSGRASIRGVTGRLNAVLSSGSLHISAYAGHDAQVVVSSGSAKVNATPKSSGRFSITVSSGSAHVVGASHLDVRKRKSSGSIHVS